MWRILSLLIVLCVLVLGLAFHVRNDQIVALNYFNGSIEMTVSTLTAAALFIGAALGVLTSLLSVFRLRHENRKLSRQLELTDKELQNLRALPMKDVL